MRLPHHGCVSYMELQDMHACGRGPVPGKDSPGPTSSVGRGAVALYYHDTIDIHTFGAGRVRIEDRAKALVHLSSRGVQGLSAFRHGRRESLRSSLQGESFVSAFSLSLAPITLLLPR